MTDWSDHSRGRQAGIALLPVLAILLALALAVIFGSGLEINLTEKMQFFRFLFFGLFLSVIGGIFSVFYNNWRLGIFFILIGGFCVLSSPYIVLLWNHAKQWF